MKPSPIREDRSELEQSRRGRAGSRLPLDWWADPRWDLGSVGRDLLGLLVTYSATNLTDGAISAPRLRMLAALTDDPQAAIRRLTDAGLLRVDVDGSATIPMDVFIIFNLTAREVETIREQTRAAGRRGGASRMRGANRDQATGRLLPGPPDDSARRASGPSPDVPPDERLDSLDQCDQTADQTRISVTPYFRRTGEPSTRADSVASNGSTPSRPGQAPTRKADVADLMRVDFEARRDLAAAKAGTG